MAKGLEMELWSRLTDTPMLIAIGLVFAYAAVLIAVAIWPRKLKVFINYRKDDTDDLAFRHRTKTSVEARAITDELRIKLGDEHLENDKSGPVRDGEVFLDVDDINPGEDWRSRIKAEHHQSAVLVCLIGRQWLLRDDKGKVRLHNPSDVLREELEAAVDQGMVVIPVLVNGADMPSEVDLPETLKFLPFRQGLAVTTGSQELSRQIDALVVSIRRHVKQINREEILTSLWDVVQLSFFPVLSLWLFLILAPRQWNVTGLAIALFIGMIFVLPAIVSFSLLRLIHDTRCREPDFNWPRAYGELLKCYYWYSLGRLHINRVARVRIEAAVLQKFPEEPVPDDNPEKHRTRMREYRLAKHDRRVKMKAAANSAHGIQSNRKAQGTPPEIQRETCFDLHNASNELKRYLSVLRQRQRRIKPTVDDQFLSRIRIQQGFLSPQFLTTGLMTAFDENWKPVLDWYGQAVRDACPPAVSKTLQRVQVFEFLCWLTWGPSVPHCQCSQWHTSSPEHTGGIFLQFGYGDENNSFLLCDDERSITPVRQFIRERLTEDPDSRAFQCTTTVRPVLISEVLSSLCEAQRKTVELGGGVILRATKIELFRGDEKSVGRRIYQAYVWMMFVLCDRDGRPLFPQEPWRGLLPFFTHGNIAEPETYAFIRQEVARKSLAAIRSLHAAAPDVTFRFACASDESNCGSKLEFPPAIPTMRGFLILEMIEATQALTREERACIILPNELRNDHEEFRRTYSACHLPELLQLFYKELGVGEDDAAPNAASLRAVHVP